MYSTFARCQGVHFCKLWFLMVLHGQLPGHVIIETFKSCYSLMFIESTQWVLFFI
jgi:hypothetical protein